VDTAIGRVPADILIRNIRLVNVFSGEIYPAEIGISGGFVAFVTAFPGVSRAARADKAVPAGEGARRASLSVFDGGDALAVPGFIDSHVHIESSMLTPDNFARIVIPRGTTVVVTDPHEIANVMGIRGVKYMLEAGRNLPMYQYAMAPSCVPAVPGLESAGASFGRDQMAEMLRMDGVLGIAEVMDYKGVLKNSPRMCEILDLAVEEEVFVQGHFFGDDPRELAAYLCGGPRSNHEFMTGNEALSAVRAGMTVDARDSSFTRDIASIIRGLNGLKSPRNITLCTDDRHPGEIRDSGHIDDCLRSAVAAGMDPVEAVRAVSINPAEACGIKRLGAIAPGYVANINLLNNLADFDVQDVFFEGIRIASGGRMLVEISPRKSSRVSTVENENTLYLDNFSEDRLRLPAPIEDGEAEIRVIRHLNERTALTEITVEKVQVRNGYVTLTERPDLNYIAIFNRHQDSSNYSVGIISNFHLIDGAVAGTVSHDSHNLALVYTNTKDAVRAVQELMRIGGGTAYACGDKLVSLALPVAGLMSRMSADELIPELDEMNRVLKEAGLGADHPVMHLATVALPVIPSVKITDHGLVDTVKQEFLDLFL
jgi:adenine deaminase